MKRNRKRREETERKEEKGRRREIKEKAEWNCERERVREI